MSKGISAQPKNLVMGPAKALTNTGTGPAGLDKNSLAAMSQVLCGALTANTMKQMLNLTGPGVLEFVGLTSEDTTARTLTVQIVIDGVQVVSASALCTASLGYGVMAAGYSSGSLFAKQEIPFTSSCVVSIQSTLTETNKSVFVSAYRTC